MFGKKELKWGSGLLGGLILLLNATAAYHAYQFTHYDPSLVEKTPDPEDLTWEQKLRTLFLGVRNPRPKNERSPVVPHDTITLGKDPVTSCWSIPVNNSKGTVILFHGYQGAKASLIPRAELFRRWGYHTVLVDLMGSGGSGGDRTTLGFKESEQVRTVYEHIEGNGEVNIYLFGHSMGAVAIMKALKDHGVEPRGIILECPFGSMERILQARFDKMGVPSFPMAELLVFWGGVLNGFPAFELRPVDYAKDISAPTLLLYGRKDERVDLRSIRSIYRNLRGFKKLRIFSQVGHEDYLQKGNKEWKEAVRSFLRGHR